MQYDFMAMAAHNDWLEKAFFAKDKKQYYEEWRNYYEKIDRDLKLEDFDFTPKLSDLDRLPYVSFMLSVPFKLRKPYLSKDDRTFHVLDNPVRKDKVFQTPMVASTSWKGALRAALWQLGRKENDEQIIRLFGNEREEEDHKKLQSGRLYFYPTFFRNIDEKKRLEVINPHDRKTGVGKNPILIECVPIDATGKFVLLYVPFGEVKHSEVAEDLKLVAEGLQAMLTVYGFGAKTSSGFGIAELNSKIELGIRANWACLEESSISDQKLEFLDDSGSLKSEFLNDDSGFKKEKQYKTFLQGQGRTHNKKLYQEAKKWWESRNDRPKLFGRREFISFESLMATAESCHRQQIEGGVNNA
ncbi:RAMP superfamily CRISPR-associated protein [Leptolyngbya sp. PCC 6406]|uniref:RAMP superfamily CRISPR-associated protein n=1 Tax=Leptolyngbya sp. PCC 6406 TaxID=1173264 RepID=UPI0002AC2E20|nr:RAMP superfamily CRISPR-associated protein [Leptolyngbya sp. PCC 6406]